VAEKGGVKGCLQERVWVQRPKQKKPKGKERKGKEKKRKKRT
jgi:hypothetical protein